MWLSGFGVVDTDGGGPHDSPVADDEDGSTRRRARANLLLCDGVD